MLNRFLEDVNGVLADAASTEDDYACLSLQSRAPAVGATPGTPDTAATTVQETGPPAVGVGSSSGGVRRTSASAETDAASRTDVELPSDSPTHSDALTHAAAELASRLHASAAAAAAAAERGSVAASANAAVPAIGSPQQRDSTAETKPSATGEDADAGDTETSSKSGSWVGSALGTLFGKVSVPERKPQDGTRKMVAPDDLLESQAVCTPGNAAVRSASPLRSVSPARASQSALNAIFGVVHVPERKSSAEAASRVEAAPASNACDVDVQAEAQPDPASPRVAHSALSTLFGVVSVPERKNSIKAAPPDSPSHDEVSGIAGSASEALAPKGPSSVFLAAAAAAVAAAPATPPGLTGGSSVRIGSPRRSLTAQAEAVLAHDSSRRENSPDSASVDAPPPPSPPRVTARQTPPAQPHVLDVGSPSAFPGVALPVSAVSAFTAGASVHSGATSHAELDVSDPDAVAQAAVDAAVAKVNAKRKLLPTSPAAVRSLPGERQKLFNTAGIPRMPVNWGPQEPTSPTRADASGLLTERPQFDAADAVPVSPTAQLQRPDVDPREAARQRRESMLAARAAESVQSTAPSPSPALLPPNATRAAVAMAPPDAAGANDADWTTWAIDSLAAAVTGGLAAVAAAADEAADVVQGTANREFTPGRTRPHAPPGSPARTLRDSPPSETSPLSPSSWVASFLGTEELEDGAQLRRGVRHDFADSAPTSADELPGLDTWNPWRSCAGPPRGAIQ